MAWPALGVLLLLSVAGFLFVLLFRVLSGGIGARVAPGRLWEAHTYLVLGTTGLLAFPAALWRRTRARVAFKLLLIVAVLGAALTACSVWDIATCVPRRCDPAEPFYPVSPPFQWIKNLGG